MTLTAAGWMEALEIIKRIGSKKEQRLADRNWQRAMNADPKLAREFEALNMASLATK